MDSLFNIGKEQGGGRKGDGPGDGDGKALSPPELRIAAEVSALHCKGAPHVSSSARFWIAQVVVV